MKFETQGFTREESVYFALRELYGSFGYRLFKMRKFEEYSLYLENMSFLKSEDVITFNDRHGKLLALKPDVTLSIVKNTKATALNTEKVYYKESVYRFNAKSQEYREISQTGLELLGDIGGVEMLEVCRLAADSLNIIDSDFVLDISHMGIANGVFEEFGIEDGEVKDSLCNCIRAKNTHGIKAICAAEGIDSRLADIFERLLGGNGDFSRIVEDVAKYALNDTVNQAVKELQVIDAAFSQSAYAEKVNFDFSIINDLGYYTGVIMQGYIAGIPHAVLSGGRYDKLIKKFNKDISAMGFAIYLDQLTYFKSAPKANDVDVLLLYRDGMNESAAMDTAAEMRAKGLSVRVEKNIPDNLKYAKLERIKE